MSNTNIKTNTANMRILIRRDTKTNWSRANSVLLLGEFGIETDTNSMKIGDGSTGWNDLPYFVGFNTIDGGSPAGYSQQLTDEYIAALDIQNSIDNAPYINTANGVLPQPTPQPQPIRTHPPTKSGTPILARPRRPMQLMRVRTSVKLVDIDS